jgi:hypothetical protein
MNFTDALAEAKRKSQLTGQPLTPQEISGMSSGWFDTAANMSAKNRAQWLSEQSAKDQQAYNEKQLALATSGQTLSEQQATDRLAQEKWLAEQQMDAADKAQGNQTVSNLVNTGGTMLGMNYLTAPKGGSLIEKGYQGAKDFAGKIIGPGDGAAQPTFTGALNAPTPVSPDLTTGMYGTPAVDTGGLVEGAAPAIGAGGGALAPDLTAGMYGTAAPIEAGGVGAGVGEGAGGSVLGAVSGPLAGIAAGEITKSLWGGEPTPRLSTEGWDEKTAVQKNFSAPGTTSLAMGMPGVLLAPEGTVVSNAYKTLSSIEQTIMKPIDWIFGNK